jgi:hypothetical protein
MSEVVLPHTVTNGGNVILYQLEKVRNLREILLVAHTDILCSMSRPTFPVTTSGDASSEINDVVSLTRTF